MKCPQCAVRNSVAATQCKDCGTRFPRKSIAGIIVKLPGQGKNAASAKRAELEASAGLVAREPGAPVNPAPVRSAPPPQHAIADVTVTGIHRALKFDSVKADAARAAASDPMVTGQNRAISDPILTAQNRALTNPVPANPLPSNPVPSSPVTTGTNRALTSPEISANLDALASPAVTSGIDGESLFADMDAAANRRTKSKAFPSLFKLPKPALIGAAGVVALIGLGALAFTIPAMFDSEGNLAKIAKRVAAGPKNGSDAEHIKSELESTTKAFLEKNAKLSTSELQEKLQKIFPNSVFEIRVFDLPHNLRLVEIDTMILPTDYLMSGKHASVMRNFEVYDNAKVVSDGTGENITLLGHRNAQAGHKPQVGVYALLPDGIADRTQESVPALSGDGNAAFATNGKDINLDLSLMSKASEEKLFTIETLAKGTVTDETVKSRLTFKGGKYELSEEAGKSPMACLRAAAFVLADSSAKDRFKKYFGSGTMSGIASIGKLKVSPPLFTLRKLSGGPVVATNNAAAAAPSANSDDDEWEWYTSRHGHRRKRHKHNYHRHSNNGGSSSRSSGGGGGTLTYLLNNAQDAFEVALSRADGRYYVSNIRRVKASTEGGDVVVQAAPQDNVLKAADNLLKDKVVVKEADLAKITAENNSANATADKDKRDKDKAKIAMTTPASPDSGRDADETDSHKQITPKVTEKKADAESGTISTSLTTPTIKVRRGASTGYRSVGELKRGADIQIIGKKDGWYKVQLDGREGYVYGGFVDCKTSDAYTTATVRRGKSVKDRHGSTIGEAQSGDRLVVVGPVTNDKYQVQLSSGRTGFLDKDAIDVTSDAPQFVP